VTPTQKLLDDYVHGLIEEAEVDMVQLTGITDTELTEAMAQSEGVARELDKEDDR
jgi:hypothetical protein